MNRLKGTPTHIILFVITLITTTLAGTEWMYGRFIGSQWPIRWVDFIDGLQFSIPFLLILTVHEFGHYLTARKNGVKVSLPYYLPLWFGFIPGFPSIGTIGAFIRIRQKVNNKTQNFDIGIAGPLAGFVAAIFVLIYGFTHLPEKEFIYEVHPPYEVLGEDFDQFIYSQDTFVLKTDVAKYNPDYAEIMPDTSFFSPSIPSMSMGSNLLFDFMQKSFVPNDHQGRIPNKFEAFHYPYLFAGFLALFFTALNLLPIGQLDGGHVIYGMFGGFYHSIISRTFFLLLVFYAGIGVVGPHQLIGGEMEFTTKIGYVGLYILFLFYLFGRFTTKTLNQLTWAVGVFAAQFFVVYWFPTIDGYPGWLLFAFFLGRVVGLDYPAAKIEAPLDSHRIFLGWLAIVIFIICFSPAPLVIIGV